MSPLGVLPPIVARIMRDRALSPRDLHVWLFASEQLDVGVYRELKVRGLAEDLGVSPSVVSGGLQRLANAGYLLREEGAPSRATPRFALPAEPGPIAPKPNAPSEFPRPRRPVVSSAAAQRLRELG